jgi:hypothetical protein
MNNTFTITQQSFFSRCEICHKTDFFDANKNVCGRCSKVNTSYLVKEKVNLFEKPNNSSKLLMLFSLCTGLLLGTFIGSILQGIALGIIFQWMKESKFSKTFDLVVSFALFSALLFFTGMLIFSLINK